MHRIFNFYVVIHDVIHDMAAFAHFGARLGAFFLLDQIFRKQCTVRLYHSNLSDQSALEI